MREGREVSEGEGEGREGGVGGEEGKGRRKRGKSEGGMAHREVKRKRVCVHACE